jgi:FKBP-type peptidyl-prolyl cis-trans isomerase
MNTKFFILILSIVTLAFTGCCNYSQTSASLKNDTDTASFYIGRQIGENFKNLGIKPNLQSFVAGINSVLQLKEAPANQQEMSMYLNAYVQKSVAAKNEQTKKDGEEFLAKNKDKKGVETTPSGLQYKVDTAGTGPIPTAADRVLVHYKGMHLDGTQFDSSFDRGDPVEFSAGGGVIPGWLEALQLMPEGSRWTLYIPANLGYGEQGQPYGGIGPNELLIFEVKLLKTITATPEGEEGDHEGHDHE